jgi:hypothetical protein
MSLLGSSLLVESDRLRIVRKQLLDSTITYDVFQKVPNTSQNGVLKIGENVTFDVNRKAIIKGLVKAEWLGGLVTNAEYAAVRKDVNESLVY